MARLARVLACALALSVGLTNASSALTPICIPNITSNTTWGPTGSPPDSAYLITCDIVVQGGATLTIQPGTTLRFAQSVWLQIGLSTQGSLLAQGTQADPIRFLGETEQPGSWAGLRFTDRSDLNGATSILDHCVFQHGGGPRLGALVRCEYTTTPTITNSEFRDSGALSIWMIIATVPVSGCTFHASGGAPLRMPANAPQAAVSGNTFVPNASGDFNVLMVDGGTIAASTVWPAPPPPFTYLIAQGSFMTVQGTAAPVLTILPGTVIKQSGLTQWRIGLNAPGGLDAEGVTFTSAFDDTLGDALGDGPIAPQPGDWQGIYFANQAVDSTSRLQECVVRYGRNAIGTLATLSLINASPTITGCTLEQNANSSLSVRGPCPADLIDCTIRDHGGAAITLDLGGVECFLGSQPGINLVPNPDARFNVIKIDTMAAGTVAASTTWPVPPPGFVYMIETGHDIKVQGPASPVVTLLPGTIIKMRGDSYWSVGSSSPGGLHATGVTFTSVFDDTLCDALGDGAVAPAAGDWHGIVFSDQTLDGASRLEDCVVRYGRSPVGALGTVSLTNASLVITGCILERNAISSLGVGGPCPASAIDCTIRAHEGAPVTLEPPSVECFQTSQPGVELVPNADGRFNVIKIAAGTLTSSATWPVPPAGFTYLFEIGHDLVVAGPAAPVLTVLSGTVIKMQGNTFWSIGGSAPGGLQATGVTFTSARDDTLGDALGDGAIPPVVGDWESIAFYGQTVDSVSAVDACLIRYGGNNQAFFGALALTDASPSVTNCVLERNRYSALGITGACTGAVASCTFRDWDSAPLDLDPQGPECVLQAASANVLVPNADGRRNVVRIHTGNGLTASSTWPVPPSGFTYLLENGEDVRIGGSGGPGLTLLPGTVVKHRAGSSWEIGKVGPGWLQATGVTFTSALDDTLGDALGDGAVPPASGDWESVAFHFQTVDAQTTMEGCLIRYGGGNNSAGFRGAVSVSDAAPTISNCVFDRNRYSSFGVETGVCPIPITGCVFQAHDSAVMDLDPRVLECVLDPVEGNTLVPNADGRFNVIKISTSPFPSVAIPITASTTWPKPPAPFTYLFENNHYLMVRGSANPVLTIAPGSIIKQRGTTQWRIGETPPGALRATRVTFTSAYDDTLGDALGDGAVAPMPGDWESLHFGSFSVDSLSRVEDCQLRYGGRPGQFGGMLSLKEATPAVNRCAFSSSQTAGVYTSGVGALQEILCSSFSGNGRGLENLDAQPRITLCDLRGNTGPAVLNWSSSNIDAEMNWWGCADGPGGTDCDSIRGLVDFDPWSPNPLSCVVTFVDPGRVGEPPATLPPFPAALSLHSVCPNPFRTKATVRYDVPFPGDLVTLRIYDVSGRLLRTLRDGLDPAGPHEVAWTGLDASGRRVASGVYFLVLNSKGVSRVERVTLAR